METTLIWTCASDTEIGDEHTALSALVDNARWITSEEEDGRWLLELSAVKADGYADVIRSDGRHATLEAAQQRAQNIESTHTFLRGRGWFLTADLETSA